MGVGVLHLGLNGPAAYYLCDLGKPPSHLELKFPLLLNGSNTIGLMNTDCDNIHEILCLQPGILKILNSNFCHFVFHNIFVHLSVL